MFCRPQKGDGDKNISPPLHCKDKKSSKECWENRNKPKTFCPTATLKPVHPCPTHFLMNPLFHLPGKGYTDFEDVEVKPLVRLIHLFQAKRRTPGYTNFHRPYVRDVGHYVQPLSGAGIVPTSLPPFENAPLGTQRA